MTLSISISAEAERNLKAKAIAAGVDVETYAARYLEQIASPAPSLSDLSGPIAGEFAKSGMAEDDLGDFLEREKHEMRAERRGNPGK